MSDPVLFHCHDPGGSSNELYIVFPCMARCFPEDKHNSGNAYILVPANPSHGLILSCSIAECVNSGRRFRYCAFCHTIVARKNFVARHCQPHGLILARRSRCCVTRDYHEKDSMAKQAMREREDELTSEVRPTKMMEVASSEAKEAITPEQEGWPLLDDIRPDSQNADDSAKWFDSVKAYTRPQKQESDPFPVYSDNELDSFMTEDILSVGDDEEELDAADEHHFDIHTTFD